VHIILFLISVRRSLLPMFPLSWLWDERTQENLERTKHFPFKNVLAHYFHAHHPMQSSSSKMLHKRDFVRAQPITN